jgi:molybdate transport system ATP-binding protein
MVFQDSGLFPHMTVRRNLQFGERRRGSSGIGFDDVVELLGIGHLLNRRPNSLSGGERQRVAIGRALLAQPALLAMDEPLAKLDAPRKAEILPFLARLKTALNLPIVYVTHSTEELAALADTLVLLDRGRVVAAGPFEEVVVRSDLLIAARDDAGAVLVVRLAEHDETRQLTALQAGELLLWVALLERAVGSVVRIRVPAREVILATTEPGPTSVHNVIPGRVRAINTNSIPRAALVEVEVSNRAALLARVTPVTIAQLNLAVGSRVVALVKSVSIEILPA